MASKWTTSKALKAINNARSDISKRKDDDDFSYEPWETGTAEEQAAQYEAFNQRIEQYKQNGGLTEAEKARRDAVRANTEAEQARQIQEQQASNAALQNALTTGSLDSLLISRFYALAFVKLNSPGFCTAQLLAPHSLLPHRHILCTVFKVSDSSQRNPH